MIGPAQASHAKMKVQSRQDVLVYTTTVLDQDVEVTGPISLILYVSTSAPNTDFTAKVVDVHPDGPPSTFRKGILRRSHQGVHDLSATDSVHEIQTELWPTSTVFFKGHRIRLEVSSSNFPRFDRNPYREQDCIGGEGHYCKTDGKAWVTVPLTPNPANNSVKLGHTLQS